jgi:hypothetical protein
MAVLASQATLRCGTLPARVFSPTNMPGDWQTYHVPFQPWMPAAADGRVRVVVSASDDGVRTSDHQAAPVALVGEVSYRGFTAWVRNSDISRGSSGLSWLAIAEVADSPPSTPRLRYGCLQPQHFAIAGASGDWRRWSVGFGSRVGFVQPPAVVATPTNASVRVHAAAVVAIPSGVTKDGFNLAARNADIGAGACNFFYVAATQGGGGGVTLQIDTGQLPARLFSASGSPGDWQVWAVSFAEPFLTPPSVLATADNSNGMLRSYARAVQGVAFDVTTDGFTLAARNTDTSAGPAGFSWVAVGRQG